MSTITRLNKTKLDALALALTDANFSIFIGIMGDKNIRTSEDGSNSNAEIGAKHEFGEDGLPVRSFLRMPLTNYMHDYLTNKGAFNKESIQKIIETKSMLQFYQKIGLVGEEIVSDAFNSGGFGQWKPSNMTYKTNQQTLVETEQLRNSVTSVVK